MIWRLLMLLLDLAFITGQTESGPLTKTTESYNDTGISPESEEFMDLEKHHLHYSNCDEHMFKDLAQSLCLEGFDEGMKNLKQENWCNWELVLSSYNLLTHCLERSAEALRCYYPNALVQAIFVDVHKSYFSSCASKDDSLPDAPARVVLVLTLLPVSVIPVLVYMVIWKSSVID